MEEVLDREDVFEKDSFFFLNIVINIVSVVFVYNIVIY